MELHFWGTAAAEAIPAVFCGCDVCAKARERMGRYARTRSQIMIDGELLVDFGPDTYLHALRYGYDLTHLTDVLVTHVHEDHFYPAELGNRRNGFAHKIGNVLSVHGPEEMLEIYAHSPAVDCGDPVEQGRVRFDFLQPFLSVAAGAYTVTAIPATHGTRTPFVYVIERGGKTAFVCNDTGPLKPDVLAGLARLGKKFDLVSYDCTNGDEDTAGWGDSPSHMGLPDVIALRRALQNLGLYRAGTIDVLTHFSHNGGHPSYDEFSEIAEPRGFLVAYDGMRIDF